MREAIQTAMESLEAPPEADLALRRQLPEPRTLHRLLGYSPSTGRFAHGPSHPLAEDIVIVDEASMIDLALMDRLVSAIRPGGQLVLVGDARQLPSVEAGAVFRDLVAGGRAVRLGSSFRTAEAKPLQELAAAVEAGDAAGVVDRLRSAERSNEKELDFECVEFLAAAEGARMRGFLDAWVERRLRSLQGLDSLLETEWSFDGGAVAPGQADDLARLRRHLESCRVLCVTRSDARPTGAQAVNHALRDAWRDQLGGGGGGRAGFAVGEPVMMLANDYARQLFNGDQGFAIRAREGGRPAELRAAFPRKDGYGLFAADAGGSGGCRHSFAMTVHKSQGSEYDHVAVVLPEDPTHPLLTREILYTAITRARRSVTIVGTLEALRQGIERQVHRHSSIARRLAAS